MIAQDTNSFLFSFENDTRTVNTLKWLKINISTELFLS
jgi:hypothetical protein